MLSRTREIAVSMLISLRNRLAFLFFASTLVAIAALYLYVAPGLRTGLIDQRLHSLAAGAERYSSPVISSITSGGSLPIIRGSIDQASLQSGARVTLLGVSEALAPAGFQLSPQIDSSEPNAAMALGYPVATRALHSARSGSTRAVTGTEETGAGLVAEAAIPVRVHGRLAHVIVFSTSVADVAGSVALVRREILIAGGIALLLTLAGGLLTARWLAARVKRLERAAERVASGEFERPIPVDSRDELGQLAATFNTMQRQLGQLDLARKRFIATASHELRTPVFSLGGFVELLEDDELDPATRRRFLDHVAEQVERLRKLSVDLLDLSRLEAGSLELRPELVDLGELMRSVAAEFEVSLAQHDSHLELRLPQRTEAQCDPVRLAQIVRILIDNAVTHTPTGTHISVTAGRGDGHVRLGVRDDGQGIPPEALSRIFEPFFTADDAQGSGLGLAIASELAERMSGALGVLSEPGHTIFTLEIPA